MAASAAADVSPAACARGSPLRTAASRPRDRTAIRSARSTTNVSTSSVRSPAGGRPPAARARFQRPASRARPRPGPQRQQPIDQRIEARTQVALVGGGRLARSTAGSRQPSGGESAATPAIARRATLASARASTSDSAPARAAADRGSPRASSVTRSSAGDGRSGLRSSRATRSPACVAPSRSWLTRSKRAGASGTSWWRRRTPRGRPRAAIDGRPPDAGQLGNRIAGRGPAGVGAAGERRPQSAPAPPSAADGRGARRQPERRRRGELVQERRPCRNRRVRSTDSPRTSAA